MQNNISRFVNYLSSLAVHHTEIRHTYNKEKHFVGLETDEQGTGLQDNLYFPALFLDEYSSDFTGVPDNFKKINRITLMILDRVPDPRDYKQILQAWNKCESIADDFVARIYSDSRNRRIPFIKEFSPVSVSYSLVENYKLGHYGIVVTFSFNTGFCEKVRPGAFDDI